MDEHDPELESITAQLRSQFPGLVWETRWGSAYGTRDGLRGALQVSYFYVEGERLLSIRHEGFDYPVKVNALPDVALDYARLLAAALEG